MCHQEAEVAYICCDDKATNHALTYGHSVCLVIVKSLKGRWRCLLKRLDVASCDVPELVAACCVLHNICETQGDTFDDQWMEGTRRQERECDTNSTTVQSEENAVTIRKAFMSHFSN